jgi:hypothetical protein
MGDTPEIVTDPVTGEKYEAVPQEWPVCTYCAFARDSDGCDRIIKVRDCGDDPGEPGLCYFRRVAKAEGKEPT